MLYSPEALLNHVLESELQSPFSMKPSGLCSFSVHHPYSCFTWKACLVVDGCNINAFINLNL